MVSVAPQPQAICKEAIAKNRTPQKKSSCFSVPSALLIRLLATSLLILLFITHPAHADHGTDEVCSRTTQVHDAIVAAIADIDDCALITDEHLAVITTLDLSGQSITDLKTGDFAGLRALTVLYLSHNQLDDTLSARIFAHQTNLLYVNLLFNRLTLLPAGIFEHLPRDGRIVLDAGVIAPRFADSFITTWETTGPDETITIPTIDSGYNYNVDCDNNGINEFTGETGNVTCVYPAAGTHTVVITGTFPRIYFNNGRDRGKVRSVTQWGTGVWTSMDGAFNRAHNFDVTATDAPDLSGVITMALMFGGSGFTGTQTDMSQWDVSTVVNMSRMFQDASAFNGNIGNWNVGKVTTLEETFSGAAKFNQDISGWRFGEGKLTNLDSAFMNASRFDQNLGGWDVSLVTDFSGMFDGTALSTGNYEQLLRVCS